MILLIVCMIFSLNLISSDKDIDDNFAGGHSVVRVRTPLVVHLTTTSISAAAASSSDSSDILCDAVFRSSVIAQSKHAQYVRPFLIEVIKESSSSPVYHNMHRVKSIERLRSGSGSPSSEDAVNINELVIEALQKAMDKQQEDIEDRWSKSSVIISNAISSIMVGVIVGIVQHYAIK